LVSGEKPTRSDSVSAIIYGAGAAIATFESLEAGVLVTLAGNVSQSLQNLYIAKTNQNKLFSPFGKSESASRVT